MKRFLFVIALVFAATAAHAGDRDTIRSALTSELNRTKDLRMEGFEPPYFVSYSYADSEGWAVGARFGAVFEEYPVRNRSLYVELRVGDYDFDSSGSGGFSMDMSPKAENRVFPGPIEHDADALRGQIWLATDQAYKNALAQYLNKKSDRVYAKKEQEKDGFADFSREDPAVYEGPADTLDADQAKWTAFLRDITERLSRVPELTENYARASVEREDRFFVSTEGANIVESDALFSFFAKAVTYADDGMRLEHSYIEYAGTADSIPTPEELSDKVDKMVEELLALREAPIIDPISAPAILDAETTGVFFHEAIGHRLEGERMRDTQDGQTFKGKVGERILPAFLTVYDDPTRESYAGKDLNGTYHYDSEGVPGERVTLVESGVLRNFLLSRAPIAGFPKSNGHGRSDGKLDPMGRMANLIVESTSTVPHEKMKKMLMREAKKQGKPYGLILKNSRGGETITGRVNFQAFMNMPQLIYKVDPDTGEETLVRGASLVGTPLVSISKIVVTDDRPGVFNGFCGAESGYIPVSAVAPAALVSEIELQRSVTQPKRPPILPSPFAP